MRIQFNLLYIVTEIEFEIDIVLAQISWRVFVKTSMYVKFLILREASL